MTKPRILSSQPVFGLFATLILFMLSSDPALAEGKPWALSVFDYSMGLTGGTCLTCNFLSYFMVSLTDFSYSTYMVFYKVLVAILPVTFSIWLVARVIKLMVTGGEDGKSFLMQIVQKLTLFFFVWIILLGGAATDSPSRTFLWNTTGPAFLNTAFKFSNQIRGAAVNNQSLATVSAAADGSVSDDLLFCPTVKLYVSITGDPLGTGVEPYSFIDPAVKTGCMTERVHFMGVASGVAIGLGQMSSPTTFFEIAYYLFQLVVKLLLGVIVMITFALSAIWLIFLILDVVVRAMVTAAFSPILIVLFLYQPTRSISTSSIKALIGSAVTAISIGLVGVLAYVLITNTVAVYNASWADVDAAYETFDLRAIPAPGFSSVSPVSTEAIPGPAQHMREFIERANVGSTDKTYGIPVDFGAPWFWYIAFCGLAIFSLGKKIITMLEQAIGTAGMSAFADRATNMAKFATKAGSTVALGGGAAVAGASLFGAAKLGMPLTAYGAGGVKKAVGGVGSAMEAMSPKGKHNSLKGVGMLKSMGKGAKLGAVAGGATGAVAGGQATTDE